MRNSNETLKKTILFMDFPPYKLFPNTSWRHEVNEIIEILNKNFKLNSQTILSIINKIDILFYKTMNSQYDDMHLAEGELIIDWCNFMEKFLLMVNTPIYRFFNLKWNSKFFTCRKSFIKAHNSSLILLARTTVIGLNLRPSLKK